MAEDVTALELIKAYGISDSYFYSMVNAGIMPPPTVIPENGAQARLWNKHEVGEAMRAMQMRRPVAERKVLVQLIVRDRNANTT